MELWYDPEYRWNNAVCGLVKPFICYEGEEYKLVKSKSDVLNSGWDGWNVALKSDAGCKRLNTRSHILLSIPVDLMNFTLLGLVSELLEIWRPRAELVGRLGTCGCDHRAMPSWEVESGGVEEPGNPEA